MKLVVDMRSREQLLEEAPGLRSAPRRPRGGIARALEGDLCCFLAADFHKEGWRDNVLAFAETCDRLALPVALERSRSGNGAHAWLFFDERVVLATGRHIGEGFDDARLDPLFLTMQVA